jgi:hypothetical protein
MQKDFKKISFPEAKIIDENADEAQQLQEILKIYTDSFLKILEQFLNNKN